MNKVYIVDENNNINKNKFKVYKKSRLNIIKKLFARKVNLEKNSNIDLNIKKNNCFNNLINKFRPNY